MKKLIGCKLAVFLLLCPALVLAQSTKKQITTAADLPDFTYSVPENAADLVTSDEAFAPFAAKVRADRESVLRDYDIQDKGTLKDIETTLLHLDLFEGKLDAAVERLGRIRELEEKPEAKLYDRELFVIAAIIKARQRSGAISGLEYQKGLRLAFAESLNRLPDSLSQKMPAEKADFEILNGDFFLNVVKARIAPMAKQAGNTLRGDAAYSLVGIRTLHRLFVPAGPDIAEAFGTYIAAHKTVKTNIWTSRAVTLTNKQKLTPAVLGIWDSGVDTRVYQNQLFVNRAEKPNGKDNDKNGFVADVNGIGFDVMEHRSSNLLNPIKESDLKEYPAYVSDRKADADLKAGIDNAQTRALKQKLQSAKPEDARLGGIFNAYMHGTHVAGIAVDGNPAARILVARLTYRDEEGKRPAPTDELVRRTAANWKTTVAYFKAHGVRVVNMSWQTNVREIESDIVERRICAGADQCRQIAIERFAILRDALYEAIKNAPEILFVAGAGNFNGNADFMEVIPSSLDLPNMLTVGAVDEGGATSDFTSFGRTVKLYSDGVDVESFVPGGERIKWSGTSMAAPQVTNLAAKLFAIAPKLKVADVVALIRDGAESGSSDKRLMLINPKRSVLLLETHQKRK